MASSPTLLIVESRGIVSVAGDGTQSVVEQDTWFGGLYFAGSKTERPFVSLKTSEGSQLATILEDGSLKTIHEGSGDVEYSASRSNGALAFGYKSNTGQGIAVFEGGEVKDVGCSASSITFGWQDSDKLLVGDGTNRYIVAKDGCATIKRLDVRKMHEIVVSPTGTRMAYILRELEYDRAIRKYVPDSSLYVSAVDGSDPQLVAGNKYRPHRPSWSPDGTELLFDAGLPEQPERRLITVFDVNQGQSAFLNPGSVDGMVNEWSAHWSPAGSLVAYTQHIGSSEPTIVVQPIDGGFATAIGEPGERFARWIDENYLVLSRGDQERLVSADGLTSVKAPAGSMILSRL